MQTANVLLALGGDKGNTVPKYEVTAAEVAVLRYIHGEDAVFDIEITGEVSRTHRQEIGRLTEFYGRQEGDRRTSPAVAELFPGAAARVFEDFEELEIPDELYVATGRKTAAPAKQKPAPRQAVEDQFDSMTVKQLQAFAEANDVDLAGVSKKVDIIEALRLAQSAKQPTGDEDDDEGSEDGVGDMNDEFSKGDNLFK